MSFREVGIRQDEALRIMKLRVHVSKDLMKDSEKKLEYARLTRSSRAMTMLSGTWYLERKWLRRYNGSEDENGSGYLINVYKIRSCLHYGEALVYLRDSHSGYSI